MLSGERIPLSVYNISTYKENQGVDDDEYKMS